MNHMFMLDIAFHLYIGFESENLVVWYIQEWEDRGKLITWKPSEVHIHFGALPLSKVLCSLRDTSEWISVNISFEWLYEQCGTVHSSFTSFVMKSLWVCLLSVWFLQPSKYEHASPAPACIIAFQHTRFAWHTSYLQTNFGLSLHRLTQRVSFKEAELSPHI